MYCETKIRKRIFSLYCGILMIFISMNIIIFSSPIVAAEGGSPEIHLNEIGFSTEFIDTLSTTLFCPRFEQNSNWETQIIITNPSENTANLVIYYFYENGALIDQEYENIDSYGSIDFISTDHNIAQESGSVMITSDVPIFGNVIYYSEYCAAGGSLTTESFTELYCPGFYQTQDWDTLICVNNIGTSTSEVTITYYDETGDEIDYVIDSLSSHEIRYFQPIDDSIGDSFGSIVIESSIGDSLIGYALKINSDEDIAYSYSLTNNLNDHLCTEFITNEDNIDELVLFNPESGTKTIDITFYNEEGNQINSISNQLISSLETYKIIINEYDDGSCFGSVDIECTSNGICGYFGHIGPNYGLANSIETTDEEMFYCTFNSYKEIQDKSIHFVNPTDDTLDIEFTLYGEEDEDDEESTINSFPLNTGFFPSTVNGIMGSGVYPIYYDPPYWAEFMVPGGPGSGDSYPNPNWWSSPDSDNDGLDDHIEDRLFPSTVPPTDTDNDGTPDGRNDPDTDGDGLKDGWEYYKLYGKTSIITNTDIHGASGDPDGDTLTNMYEYVTSYLGKYTHPKWLDTDDDGRNDGVEANNDMNPTEKKIKWTIMVYLDGDNNLEHDSMICFQEMENVGSSDDLTIIAQYDRISWQQLYDYYHLCKGYNGEISEENANFYDDDNFNDWSDTRRYLVLEDDDKDNWESYRLDTDDNLGELGMGNDEVLEDFVEWGTDNFPADNSILILWDHGGGWTGCCNDYKSYLQGDDEGKVLTPTDLKTALMAATNNGNDKLDIIGFDCCLMANFEILYQIRNTAYLTVASENVEIGIRVDDNGNPLNLERGGWPYDNILNDLINNHDSEWSKEDFAEKIVDNYIECWTDDNLPEYVNEEFTPTMTTIKMDKLYGLKSWIDKFAEELETAMEDSNCGDHYKLDFWESKHEDYGVKEIYSDPLSHHNCLYDLYQYADWWVQNCTKSSYTDDNYYLKIIQYAKQIKNYTLDLSNKKSITYEDHGEYTDSTPGPIHGLNIYLPYEEKNWNGYYDYEKNVQIEGDRDYYINQLNFAEDTDWDEMIDAKYPPE